MNLDAKILWEIYIETGFSDKDQEAAEIEKKRLKDK
jgi:hypothetical protein